MHVTSWELVNDYFKKKRRKNWENYIEIIKVLIGIVVKYSMTMIYFEKY